MPSIGLGIPLEVRAPVGSSDPYAAYYQLLLHLDGADASTTIVDSSGTSKTCTVVGTAALSTTQQKFGASSAYVPDISSSINCSDAAFAFGAPSGNANDFCCEAFFYPTAYGNPCNIFSCAQVWAAGAWALQYNRSVEDFKFTFLTNSGSLNVKSVTTAAYNTWHHVALTRYGTAINVWLNGVSIITTGSTEDLSRSDLYTTGGTAYFDEVRVLKGICPYTTSFTPPAAPFNP